MHLNQFHTSNFSCTHFSGWYFLYIFFGTHDFLPKEATIKKKTTENRILITSTTHHQTSQNIFHLSFDPCCTYFPKFIMLIMLLMHSGKNRSYILKQTCN